MSVRPSVCPHGTTRLPLDGFHKIWYLTIFRKSTEKIQVSLKSDENKGYFIWRPIYIFFVIPRSFLLIMKNISKIVEKIETHFMLNNFFFPPKIMPFMRWCGKILYRVGQATDDNMAHAHCMLDAYGYKYTLRLCNAHCSSTATVVAQRASMSRYKYLACPVPYNASLQHGFPQSVLVVRSRSDVTLYNINLQIISKV